MLLLLGFVAGIVTGLTPCVLPVLPIIAAASVVDFSKRRLVAVASGLALSFGAATLAGSWFLTTLNLPQSLLRDIGTVALIVIGASFIFPKLGELVEKPFARFSGRDVSALRGFPLGLSLGLVFVPCAGPVLATVAVVGATNHFSFGAVELTVAYSIGVTIPLFIIGGLLGRSTQALKAFRLSAGRMRLVAGVVIVVLAFGMQFGWLNAIQRFSPSYVSKFENAIGGSGSGAKALHGLTKHNHGSSSPLNFTGATSWLNSSPESAATLKGKVVLIDFWTYSCINCQRTLPHVEAWWQRYKSSGLVVIGVHTPEFAFEHDRSNVKTAAHQLGVTYPIVLDNQYSIWNSFNNQYWPAEYIFDRSGKLVHTHFGEGEYSTTESTLRNLLSANGAKLPAPTNVASVTSQAVTPESYLGSSRISNYANATVPLGPSNFTMPSSVPSNEFAFVGSWNESTESALAGANASIVMSYQAKQVDLVMGGTGTVTITEPGFATSVIDVRGIPNLYVLRNRSAFGTSTMKIKFSTGIRAYDFTFG